MSIQQTIGKVVLTRIRARSGSDSDVEVVARMQDAVAAQTSVRTASFSDFECICAMNRRLGQGPDSLENWYRLWRDNPALADGKKAGVIGWVLEDRGGIVGFLGSVPLLYEYGAKTLGGAATCRFAVEPAYRALSHLLVTSFFRQKDVDLFLNTTATVAAGKIMTALKANPIPQVNYDTVLYWVLNPSRFANAVFKKMGLNAGATASVGMIASVALRCDIALRRRLLQNRSAKASISEMDVQEMGAEFESFWLRKKQESHRLFAARTRAILRWHFLPPRTKRVVRVLASYSAGRLNGYLVLRHDGEAGDGIRRTIVADLLVADDNAEIIGQLMSAAYHAAKRAGSDVLEVVGFPSNVRQVFARSKPYTRTYPACPFFYKVRDGALKEKLRREDAWYACPYDGDTTLWP